MLRRIIIIFGGGAIGDLIKHLMGMDIKSKAIILIFLFLVLSTQNIQSLAVFEGTPIEIVTTSEDIVGRKLVVKLREDITRSASLKITSDKKEPRLKVSIVTLDPGIELFKGNWTIYSLVVSYCAGPVDTFITQYVGMTSDSNVKKASERIILTLSNARYHYEEYRKLPDYGQLLEIVNGLSNNLNETKKQLEEEKGKSWLKKMWE